MQQVQELSYSYLLATGLLWLVYFSPFAVIQAYFRFVAPMALANPVANLPPLKDSAPAFELEITPVTYDDYEDFDIELSEMDERRKRGLPCFRYFLDGEGKIFRSNEEWNEPVKRAALEQDQ